VKNLISSARKSDYLSMISKQIFVPHIQNIRNLAEAESYSVEK